MKYHFKVHREKNGYWAECIELAGCLTQAESRSELSNNMSESLNLYLSEPESSILLFPMPKKNIKAKNVVRVEVNPNVAFAVLLRQIRLKRKLTQKAMMDLLEITHLSNYQRLENPRKTNPELKTLSEIKKKLPELDFLKILG